MAAIVGIISRPNKSKLALYNALLIFYSNLKQLTRWSISIVKVGVAYVGIQVWKCLQEELV